MERCSFMDGEMRCKVCGKLASEDSHFYKRKMLCNRHYIQMQRHGTIISEKEIRHKYEKICDICGDTQSHQYRKWCLDDDYNGITLCNKHYTQLKEYGRIKDKYPSSHIAQKDRVCDICGSNHHVIYHEGKYYCLRHYSQIKNLGGLKDKTIFDKNDYIIDNDIAYIILRDGKHEEVDRAIIDVEDLERVLVYKWGLGTWGYAETKINGKSILMQRMILNEFDSKNIPDHINRNTLDNRKSNLRIVDKSLNAINAGVRPNNTSGVTGVSWNKNANSWRAYINYQGKRIELGHRKNFEDAVVLRLNAENKYYVGMQPQKELFKKYGVEICE